MRQPSTPVDRVRIFRTTITKWQIKVLLASFGLAIVAGVLVYTKTIVDELITNEQRTVELYAKQLARLYEANTDEELLHYIDVTVASIYFPVILTDSRGRVNDPFSSYTLNVVIDTTLPLEQQRSVLQRQVRSMEDEYAPYIIRTPEGKVVTKLYYANSDLVRRLQYMPFVGILIVSAFILIGYVAFSTIRRNEESNIWVGMAKEAAHQLGTPLSSLLAWLEILRLNRDEAQLVEQTADEMQRDVERLNVIANRFSKIGSQPALQRTRLAEVVDNVCDYFETRLPNLGKRIVLVRDLDPEAYADVNVDLFQWVIENLIKNAVDAMDRPDGRIEIELGRRLRGGLFILVRDNGKGMTSQVRSRVFQPGYTTKRRGWGLGLSLSRRIVEEYHGGKIYVKESAPGAGTTFAIELP